MGTICEKSVMALAPDGPMSIDGKREGLVGLNPLPLATRPPTLNYRYSLGAGYDSEGLFIIGGPTMQTSAKIAQDLEGTRP